MTRKDRNGRRIRGSDGKLYDPKKQADNGHRAHETRAGTVARRTRWRSKGAARSVAGGVSRFGHGLLTAMVWLALTLVIRPAAKLLHVVWIGLNKVAGWLGGLLGRGRSQAGTRSSKSRFRRGR